ncbi:hypothetical protein [Lacticaseibacillus jixiensis]|uniref:hypothetical protein n=1 Tax=Lacticaseibacillus jixiensis TaxID=3231926 RepID=UPI0036F3608D
MSDQPKLTPTDIDHVAAPEPEVLAAFLRQEQARKAQDAAKVLNQANSDRRRD